MRTGAWPTAMAAVLWATSVALAGCSGTQSTCTNVSCPAITASSGLVSFVPSDLPSPLVSVSGSSDCQAGFVSKDAGASAGDAGASDGAAAEVPVWVQPVALTAGKPSICHIEGTLADGRQAAGEVTFDPIIRDCCPAFHVTFGTFTLTDAGLAGGP